MPSKLFQIRSEYRFPRADIERELLNKTILVTGWPAREGINTFCDPVCGFYGTEFRLDVGGAFTPNGDTLVVPPPIPGTRDALFMSIADLNAPLTLKGKITRFKADPQGVNPQLWIEATSVEPASTVGSGAGTIWAVAGFPWFPSDDWIGRTVTIYGYNVEDKRCQPGCLIAGRRIYMD